MVDAIPNIANRYTLLAFGFPAVIPQSQQQDMQYYFLSL